MMTVQTAGDDLESWSEIAHTLSKLKQCIEHGQEFSVKYSKYLNSEDRISVSDLNSKYDQIYWRYFEKFVKKIRGF